MKTVGVYEAKTHLPRMLAEVEKGESFMITRHGKPIAKLVATDPKRQPDLDLAAEFAELRRGVTLDIPVRQAIEEGRR